VLLSLDLNCFNRPFDNQSQDRIAREAAAVFSVLHRIVDGIDHLAWSAVLEFENSQHPLIDRRTESARWAHRAVVNVAISDRVSARAQTLTEAGFGALDAAHVACAEVAACDCLLTCDDRLMRQARRVQPAVHVQNPVEYLEEQIHV
jgi:predicted nucleic acid-binding protein